MTFYVDKSGTMYVKKQKNVSKYAFSFINIAFFIINVFVIWR